MKKAITIILCASILFMTTDTTTHWFLNDEGKIQAQMDSIFQLRRPYDFLALIQQEQREKQVEQLKKELVHQKSLIDKHEDKDTQLEERIYGTYSDCILAERPLTRFNLYSSTNIDLEHVGINVQDHLGAEPPKGTLYQEPDCDSMYSLPFSMFSMDHLKGVVNRSNLSASREDELAGLNGNFDLGVWGHQTAVALKKNNTSWILYTIGAQYWRVRANAHKAIDCVRRALFFAPREHRHIPLLHLGNILHRSRESEEAAIALHMAVDLHKNSHVIYGTLGSVYAIIGYYNVSVVCLENALHIAYNQSPYLEKLRHAVLCHAHLESSLGKQLQSLQHTLGELRDYQKKHDEWLSLQQKLLLEQATPEMKLESRLEYEEQKIRESADGRGQDCFQYQQDGHTFLSCNMRRDQLEQQGSTELLLDLHSLLHAVETEIMRIGQQVLKKKPSLQVALPLVSPLAPSVNKPKNMLTSSPKILSENFPTDEQCEEAWSVPDWNEFPTVFLPSENKNIQIEEFLNWKVPSQPDGTSKVPNCPSLLQLLNGIDEVPRIKERHAEFTWFPDHLAELALTSYGGNMDEMGHGIATALTETPYPHWALYNLAGLYWRANGNTQKGIECLRRSLSTVPANLMDVPLVNLASLLYKSGHIDDALTIAVKAFKIDSTEVETNFLLANLNFAKGNITGAWTHYKQVLSSRDHEEARQYLKSLACHIKNPSKEYLNEQPDQSCPSKDDDVIIDEEDDNNINENTHINLVSSDINEDVSIEVIPEENEAIVKLEDDLLPDVLLRVREKSTSPLPPRLTCEKVAKLSDIKHFTSTWLSCSAKDIDISDYLVPSPKEGTILEEPICQHDLPASMHTLDHLSGMKQRDKLPAYSEIGLKDAFQTIADKTPQPMDLLATRIARSLYKNESSWVVATAAALYWRVIGSGPRAVDCLRQALHYAPRNMKDIPLISLSNIFHRSGLPNAALIVCNMALEISPNFVVVHFSMANIYAAKGDFEKAAAFYQSTLSLQSTFEPARERLRIIQCASAEPYT